MIIQPHPQIYATTIANLLHLTCNTTQYYQYLRHTLKPQLSYTKNPSTQPKLTDNIHTIEYITPENTIHTNLTTQTTKPYHKPKTTLKLIVTNIEISSFTPQEINTLTHLPQDITEYLPSRYCFLIHNNPNKTKPNAWLQNWVTFNPKNIETLQQ